MENVRNEYGLAQAEAMVLMPPEMTYKRHAKRGIDVVSGTLLLVLLSPVMLFTALLCATCFRGKVFFIQERLGLGCRKFKVYKFKTMDESRGENGVLLPDDQRVTRCGTFLRNHSLDELPQLINVIRGDMSLIGPRPLIEEQVRHCNEEQLRRYEVRPGITGLAQVSGRNGIPFERRFRYDVWYVKHQSLQLDLKILVMTAKAVLGIDTSRNIINYDPLIGSQHRKSA